MGDHWDVIIVGGGIAGVTAFDTIKAHSPGTRVLLVNGEDRPPYKRTKLSKFLVAGFSRDQFALRDENHFSEATAAYGIRVMSIDASGRSVGLSDGTEHGYQTLILANGVLPVIDPTWSPRVYTLRSAADAECMRDELAGVKDVVVIGTGILGVEVADQLRGLGASVTIVGSSARPMVRELDIRASEHLTRAMEISGVSVRNECKVEAVTETSSGSLLVSGSHWDVKGDAVVACIGTQPDLSLAMWAGVDAERGIKVDWNMQTSVDGILAAGDVTELPGSYVPHLWHQAESTGHVAGCVASGRQIAFRNIPFRTKCEVFDHYFFSVGCFGEVDDEDAQSTCGRNEPYRRFSFKGNECVGIIMIDDPENAKLYEKAVREKWTRDQVEARFLKI